MVDNDFRAFSFPKYPFSPLLGWSISRFELFDKCKRQYYYTYYGKFTKETPLYKINQLKNLTSIPLETGNVVHDVLEAFLKRLQKSDQDIDETRFYAYAHDLAKKYFSQKTFIELYYGYQQELPMNTILEKIDICLGNFIGSSCYHWIFMAALHNRKNWIIEPDGYGETRLDGLKVYCKMDFLLPVDESIYILDWKTGKRDEAKHAHQLIGYSAAAATLFNMEWKYIHPRIVYLYPTFDEFEITVGNHDKEQFFSIIREQTQAMYQWCHDIENNIPLTMEAFEKSPSPSMCKQCKFYELCFPEYRSVRTTSASADF